jgi:hypothetical protein
MKRLKRLYSYHLRCVLELAVSALTICERISRVGWLRPWLMPDRRNSRAHWVLGDADRRQVVFPIWLAVAHVLATLITWLIFLPNVSPWFLPFIWAASLSTTVFLWASITHTRRFAQG